MPRKFINGEIKFTQRLFLSCVGTGSSGIGSIIAGFVLNFIFVNYRVSVRQSVADSMKNVINALL
ncbi:hypothetical protein, partial [Treponema paraluiscuniculi]|uniref:hypothetical protein n=1 Tax=Treponema paraluiscuniculi TaxID=53435 RepID=UPI002FDC056A